MNFSWLENVYSHPLLGGFAAAKASVPGASNELGE